MQPLHKPFNPYSTTLTTQNLLSLFKSGFEALNNLHLTSYVHRDIKNENFVIELERKLDDSGNVVVTETGRLLLKGRCSRSVS